MEENVQDLGFLKDFAGLEISKLLGVQDRALLAAASERYRHYTTGKISEVPFQNKAVDLVVKSGGVVPLEIATGGGKTVIAAKVAIEHLRKGGKVVYVCPNVAALGSEGSGIIQIFHKVLNAYKVRPRLGSINTASKTNDINFFTPHGLVHLRRISPKLFSQLMELSSLILLDEAHHYPEDDEGALKIFGKVPAIAREFFLEQGKTVMAFTATYGRLDGKTVVGKAPMYRFTVKDSVDEGRCPEIHGLQVYLPFKCPKAKRKGSDYDLGLRKKEYSRYWSMIAGYMVAIWKRFPVPMAACVRLKAEADFLVRIFNKASGLEGKGLAVLTGDTPRRQREKIITGIREGTLVGYVTCGVGVESIDIPPLEVVHMIQRTRSINKIVQFVGRSLRLHEGKKRALVVDYQVLKESIIRACNGIMLYAEASGMDPEKVMQRPNGGAIVFSKTIPEALEPDAKTFAECEEWVIRELRVRGSETEKKKEVLFRMAQSGAPRPTDYSLEEWEGVPHKALAHVFYRIKNEKSKDYDVVFLDRLKAIPDVHSSWIFLRRESMAERKQHLITLAKEGKPKPKWGDKEEHKLAFSLAYWTTANDPRYDPEFDRTIRGLRPDWFDASFLRKKEFEENRLKEAERQAELKKNGLYSHDRVSLPEGHWLESGIHAEMYRYRSDKGWIQQTIIEFANKGGQFPDVFNTNDPTCYWISEWSKHGADHLRQLGHKIPRALASEQTIFVPHIWDLSKIWSDVYDFGRRGVIRGGGGGRRYDSSFSWEIKYLQPEWRCHRSVFDERVHVLRKIKKAETAEWRDYFIGLSPWEKAVKREEREFFESIHLLTDREAVQRLEKFHLMDGELPSRLDFGHRNVVAVKTLEGAQRLGDIEWGSRFSYSKNEEKLSPIEEIISSVYESLRTWLVTGVISQEDWVWMDEAIQAWLCDDKKIDAPGHLAQVVEKVEVLLGEIERVSIPTLISRSPDDDEDLERFMSREGGSLRFDVTRLVFLLERSSRHRRILAKADPEAAQDPRVLFKRVHTRMYEGESLKNRPEEEAEKAFFQIARSGAPFPIGQVKEIMDLCERSRRFVEFLYDERLDWLREVDRVRATDARRTDQGVAVEEAPRFKVLG